jgi:hypothetical protein
MKATFVAGTVVPAIKVNQLLGEEFRRRHHITAWNGTGGWSWYKKVELEYTGKLSAIVIRELAKLGFTKAPR